MAVGSGNQLRIMCFKLASGNDCGNCFENFTTFAQFYFVQLDLSNYQSNEFNIV